MHKNVEVVLESPEGRFEIYKDKVTIDDVEPQNSSLAPKNISECGKEFRVNIFLMA